MEKYHVETVTSQHSIIFVQKFEDPTNGIIANSVSKAKVTANVNGSY